MVKGWSLAGLFGGSFASSAVAAEHKDNNSATEKVSRYLLRFMYVRYSSNSTGGAKRIRELR